MNMMLTSPESRLDEVAVSIRNLAEVVRDEDEHTIAQLLDELYVLIYRAAALRAATRRREELIN
ncbi:MAG: hypothetical protein EA385_05270 [Salinarimonadaceae bacterium]|nr:MAG: hypothetical protein EA385_05270 [Salinarimonadaceae bacterium]